MHGSRAVLALVVAGTVLGLMGIDLVLPAIPTLPEALGGTAAAAQMVLAAYVGGTCCGLVAFGMLGDHVSTHRLFVGSLACTAVLSWACAQAGSIEALVMCRALQGAVAAGPAVLAPALVRALLPPGQAVRALGLVGSVESLTPALAPVLGAALLTLGKWQLSFHVLAVLAAVLAGVALRCGPLPQTSRRQAGSYARLLGDPVFLRYALSQAFVLGGLLVFVFGMPAVFVRALGGAVSDFITMQVVGISAFVAAANLSSRCVARHGAEVTISFGSALAAAGAACQMAYALAGGSAAWVITLFALPLNVGLGLRGPPGFYRAVLAAQGDDARGAALVLLCVFGIAAVGTAAVSASIEAGAAVLTAVVLALELAALLCLRALPTLLEAPSAREP